MRYNHDVRWLASMILLAGCSSKPAPPPAKPAAKPVASKAPAETEAQRESKRLDTAYAIVPKGSNCLPAALREKGAPRLEIAAIGVEAVLCAIDTSRDRLLGVVGCWQADLASGGLTYREPSPLPGIGFALRIEDRCVRGFCLPDDAKLPADQVAHVAYNLDGSEVAVIASEEVHLFDAKTQARQGRFSIKGVGQVAALHWVGDTLFVEIGDDKQRRVLLFKTDGTKLGSFTDDHDAPITTGSFSLLDKTRVAFAEPGWSALWVLDTDSGKKTRIPRTLPKSPCTADETAAWWAGKSVPEACVKHMTKNFDHLIGATAVAGARNLLLVLRNGRLGELGVLDASTLVEKKSIGLAWCEETK